MAGVVKERSEWQQQAGPFGKRKQEKREAVTLRQTGPGQGK